MYDIDCDFENIKIDLMKRCYLCLICNLMFPFSHMDPFTGSIEVSLAAVYARQSVEASFL